MSIAKNNLAYPLLKDTFTLLGSSKCKVLLVLDLKDAFHSLRLTESSKKYCRIPPYFGSASYLYQRMPMGFNISPMLWQLYINAILSCLSSRKYCEAIMDDLLLFTPNKDLSQGEENNLGPDLTLGLVPIMIESGVIAVGNTIVLCPNVLIPQLTRRLTMKM